MSSAAVRSLLSRRCLGTPGPRPTVMTPAAAAASSVAGAAVAHGGAPAAVDGRRGLHGSAPLAARIRKRFPSLPAVGLETESELKKAAKKHFPEYTAAQLERLSRVYSPEQMKALKAGEAAIDPKDLVYQGRLRRDPYQLGYIDDMSKIQPIIDRRARQKPAPDTKAKFMSPTEFTDDFLEWLQSFVPKDVNLEGLSENELASTVDKYAPSSLDVLKYITERSSMTDRGRGSNSAMAPALMDKVPGVAGRYARGADPEDEGRDDAGVYAEAKKQTGLSVFQMTAMPFKHLVLRAVSNQTRLGKVRTWHVMTLVGNNNGRIGLGEAKSTELMIAKQKSRLQAIKNMMPIRRYENRTIFGQVEAKISGTVVKMQSRPPGFGLRASHRIFEICRLAGIKDISARIPRSRCPMNTVKATIKCLTDQVDPESIAIGRGKKMVDVRKVYYGGAVY